MELRKIKRVSQAQPVMEGAGVKLKRAFGYPERSIFDPFLLLDDFRSDNPADYLEGFPWHPHRGIETITYMLQGQVEHADSMGNRGTISSGDVQWMTAGSGIIHQEMPLAGTDGKMYGFQLWANLPASHKMMDPRYRDIKTGQIPEINAAPGVNIRIVCGTVNGQQGPVTDVITDPMYLDIRLAANTDYIHPLIRGHNAFAYVYNGALFFSSDELAEPQLSQPLTNTSLVLFGDGDGVRMITGDTDARLLLLAGRPLNESIAWYGPMVMNTQKEIEQALDEYRKGNFIRHT